jgi:3-methyladenine DNA glycosylase AlkD
MTIRKTTNSKRSTPARKTRTNAPERDVAADVGMALSWLQRRGSRKNREGMARYGIVAKKVFGVSMGTMQSLAKRLGKSHELAAALWRTGWYEARMLACMVDEPARVSAAQMDRWAKAFDNWAVCDTATFVLFDRTPHAWPKVREWSRRDEEFVKRAAFALLASLTVHDKQAPDERYLEGLALIEREAGDNRNFVKKAVNWALRSIGKRSTMLNRRAVTLARRLAASPDASRRWIGKDALRELTGPAVQHRLAAKASRSAKRA